MLFYQRMFFENLINKKIKEGEKEWIYPMQKIGEFLIGGGGWV